MIQRTRGEKIFNVFNYIILIVLGLTTVYPLLYTFTISVSKIADATRPGLHLLPDFTDMTFQAYKLAFQNPEVISAYGWTIWRAVVGTVLGLIVTCFYGYALSRPNLMWKKFFSGYLMFTMIFSGGQIPVYLNIKSLGLLDNVWVYVLPLLISAYNTVVAKSFFVGIPEALNESARIDGAGEFRTFFQIIVPLSKPIVMTLALWMAVMHWNSWFDSMLYMDSNSGKIVIQQYIRRIVLENDTASMTDFGKDTSTMTKDYTSETVKSASIMVTVLPILLFYPFVQRFFIKGVTLGAVKG